MILRITGGKIISGGKTVKEKFIYIKDGVIIALTSDELPYDEEIDAQENYISSGFIDIHVHGGGGCDFLDGTAAAIAEAAELHAEHGTTSIFPTSPSCSMDKLNTFLENVREAMVFKNINVMGAHLEGPYFSKEQCGALNTDYIKNPDREEYCELIRKWGGIIKRWSFAPELAGSIEFLKYLNENGIVGAIGHSNGVLKDVQLAYDNGCRLVTHLYSGMSTITRHFGFRQLGVVEASFLTDDMMTEVIADGKHLPLELLQLIFKIKGVDNICLITDAMRGAGMSDGPSILGDMEEGTPCIIEDGVAKLTDRSAFAGSVATSDRLVRTVVKAGMSIADAVKMITINPAKAMRLTKKGDIRSGMDADIVFFDSEINIKKVIISGREFSAERGK